MISGFLRRVNRQRRAGLDIRCRVARTAGQPIATKRPAFLVGVRHFCPPHVRGRGVDRPVVMDHQPPVLPSLLDPAAGQAGMRRVLAFAHAFHGAVNPIKILKTNIKIQSIPLISSPSGVILLCIKRQHRADPRRASL